MELSSSALNYRQSAAVERMLNLNSVAPTTSDQWSDQWKVLVYDRSGRDIISPLLNVAQLRRNGVTLHMLLDSDREPIPDVPAIYFCRPTPANIQRIAKDCSNKLYASMHLNFISKLERRLMEDLARLVVEAGSVQTIAKVYDQHLDFVTLEPNLFTLNQRDSYLAYNRSDLTEEGIGDSMRAISNGLFSVLATLGAMPIIRAPSQGPSEMVARQLSDLVSQAWAGGSGPFADQAGSAVATRPLVIILDRALDFSTALAHTCTYQALVDDVLDFKMNRVTVSDGSAQGKAYDLEVEQDSFWKKNAPRAFPEAIDDNSQELTRIKELEKEIKDKTAGSSEAAAEASTAEVLAAENQGGGTQELLATVDSLPKLLERKKKLESHTNILQATMKCIAARELPVFYEAETSDRPDKEKLVGLLGSSSKGTLSDKLRLLAVLTLRGAGGPEKDKLMGELEEVLKKATIESEKDELAAGLEGIKHMRQMQQMQNFQNPGVKKQAEVSKAPPSSASGIGSWMQSKTAGILGQVQSFLAQTDDTYVTRVIDNLCDFKPGSEDDTFLSLDPRKKDGGAKSAPAAALKTRAPFREVLVFLVGSGSYAEFQHVQEYAKKHPERQVTYGCTELVNGEAFLRQLGALKS